jgi:hypothetical protein
VELFNSKDELGFGERSSSSNLGRFSGKGLICLALFHPLKRLEGNTPTDRLVAVIRVAPRGRKTLTLGVEECKGSNKAVGFVFYCGVLIFVAERWKESVD